MEVEVRSKEERYRGKTLEYLKTLEVRECAKYLPARSRRSVMRHFEVIEKFIKMCDEKESRNKKIKTHFRDLVIVPRLVGRRIEVHSGKAFQEVFVVSEMIGHRLGEFAFTRKRVAHSAAGIGATKGSRALKK